MIADNSRPAGAGWHGGPGGQRAPLPRPDVGVVEGTPFAVAVGARADCLAVRETVLSFILGMTRRAPKVKTGVPATGVEGAETQTPEASRCV